MVQSIYSAISHTVKRLSIEIRIGTKLYVYKNRSEQTFSSFFLDRLHCISHDDERESSYCLIWIALEVWTLYSTYGASYGRFIRPMEFDWRQIKSKCDTLMWHFKCINRYMLTLPSTIYAMASIKVLPSSFCWCCFAELIILLSLFPKSFFFTISNNVSPWGKWPVLFNENDMHAETFAVVVVFIYLCFTQLNKQMKFSFLRKLNRFQKLEHLSLWPMWF